MIRTLRSLKLDLKSTSSKLKSWRRSFSIQSQRCMCSRSIATFASRESNEMCRCHLSSRLLERSWDSWNPTMTMMINCALTWMTRVSSSSTNCCRTCSTSLCAHIWIAFIVHATCATRATMVAVICKEHTNASTLISPITLAGCAKRATTTNTTETRLNCDRKMQKWRNKGKWVMMSELQTEFNELTLIESNMICFSHNL